MMPVPCWSTCAKSTASIKHIHSRNIFFMKLSHLLLTAAAAALTVQGCKMKSTESAVGGDAASRTYDAPGKYDELYNFVSGGFSGQVSVYGIPSGRLLKVLPVFSVNPENGYGYSEETKPML